jgi:hypothetical protein
MKQPTDVCRLDEADAAARGGGAGGDNRGGGNKRDGFGERKNFNKRGRSMRTHFLAQCDRLEGFVLCQKTLR